MSLYRAKELRPVHYIPSVINQSLFIVSLLQISSNAFAQACPRAWSVLPRRKKCLSLNVCEINDKMQISRKKEAKLAEGVECHFHR